LDFMVYPNPASDMITVGFDNLNSGKIKIELLDMMGNIVALIDERNMPTGLQTISWNVADVAQGVYLVRITGQTQQISKPLIISEK